MLLLWGRMCRLWFAPISLLLPISGGSLPLLLLPGKCLGLQESPVLLICSSPLTELRSSGACLLLAQLSLLLPQLCSRGLCLQATPLCLLHLQLLLAQVLCAALHAQSRSLSAFCYLGFAFGSLKSAFLCFGFTKLQRSSALSLLALCDALRRLKS